MDTTVLAILLTASTVLSTPLAITNVRDTPPIPSGCSPVLSYPIADFTFFNSTHNLDCTVSHPSSETVCFKSGPNGDLILCDSTTDPDCTSCPPVCYTGTPNQPDGYGPPDHVSFSIPGFYGSGDLQCVQENPQSIRRHEVGEGMVGCGGAGSYAFFYGSSERNEGETGTISFAQRVNCGEGVYSFGYEAVFPLECTHDEGRNATCGVVGDAIAVLTNVS